MGMRDADENDLEVTLCLDAHVPSDNEANLNTAFEAFSIELEALA
jgi:hypothetical protein